MLIFPSSFCAPVNVACAIPANPTYATEINVTQSFTVKVSLVMEFLGNFFSNFIFEKLLSHEALVMGRVTATSNNQTQLFK